MGICNQSISSINQFYFANEAQRHGHELQIELFCIIRVLKLKIIELKSLLTSFYYFILSICHTVYSIEANYTNITHLGMLSDRKCCSDS